MVTSPRARAWSWTLSLSLAAVLLYLSLRGIDWRVVLRILAGTQWSFIGLSFLVASFSCFLRAVRWRILLNAEGQLRIPTVFWGNMVGYLGNSFLPARAGEVLRSLLMSRHGSLSRTYVLTTALAERLADVIALVLWSSVVLLGGVNPKPRWITDVSRTMAIVAGIGAVTIAVAPHAGRLVDALLQRLPPGRFRKPLMELAGQVLLGLRAFHEWGRFLGFAGLTAAIWFMDSLTTVTLGRALNMDIGFTVAILLITGLGLSSALPSTPGYVGIYQFVAVTVLGPFGFGRDAALAFILMFQALNYVLVLFYGVPGFYLLEGRGSLRRLMKQGQA